MTFLFPYVLFLHVLGAILAFGPTFAYSILGAMGGREPQHANFALRVTAAIGTKLVYPLAIFQGVTGVALILIGGVPLMSRPWLLVAIVLYVMLLAYAFTVQRDTLHELIDMTSAPPSAGGATAPGMPPPAGSAGTTPGPGGPPPAMMALVRKVQRGGMFMGLTVTVIVFLMVVKPGG